MSSASNLKGPYNIFNSNRNNNNNNNQNITTESFIPGNFYVVEYRKYNCSSNGLFSSGYVTSVFYKFTEDSGVHELINGLTRREITNANQLKLGRNDYVLLINVNEEHKQNRGKFELVVLNKVRSVNKLKNNEFTGLNLSGLQLQGAYLRKADLRNTDLEGTTLIKAKLQEAHLEDVNLIDFDLFGAKLKGAHLQRAQLQKASLANADLRGADLREADLRGAKLEGAKLEGVRLTETNLNRASLTRSQRNGIIIVPKNWNNSSNSSHNGGRFLHLYKSGNSKTRSVKEKAFITFKKI